MGLRKTEERRGEGVGVGKSRSYVVELPTSAKQGAILFAVISI